MSTGPNDLIARLAESVRLKKAARRDQPQPVVIAGVKLVGQGQEQLGAVTAMIRPLEDGSLRGEFIASYPAGVLEAFQSSDQFREICDFVHGRESYADAGDVPIQKAAARHNHKGKS